MSMTTTPAPSTGLMTRIHQQEPAQAALLDGLRKQLDAWWTAQENGRRHEEGLARCLADQAEADSAVDAIRVALEALGDLAAITLAHEMLEARR